MILLLLVRSRSVLLVYNKRIAVPHSGSYEPGSEAGALVEPSRESAQRGTKRMRYAFIIIITHINS